LNGFAFLRGFWMGLKIYATHWEKRVSPNAPIDEETTLAQL
jgi:hypothetical protein